MLFIRPFVHVIVNVCACAIVSDKINLFFPYFVLRSFVQLIKSTNRGRKWVIDLNRPEASHWIRTFDWSVDFGASKGEVD